MAASIASLLADFSPLPGGENAGIAILKPVRTASEPPVEPPVPVVDRHADLIHAAEARVREEEREAARKTLENAIAAEKARHEDELAMQRTLWVEQQGQQLSMQIVEALGRIELIVSERVAAILKPFVTEAFRQQSIAEFKESLATLLFDGETKLMRIAGPEDVLAAIGHDLGSRASVLEFMPGDHVEVSVVAQETTIQTQLSAWSVRLEQALKAE